MAGITLQTLEAIVQRHVRPEDRAATLAALYEREDGLADALRAMGAQFGLYPEIVAECITNAAQMGTPVSEEQHQHIRQQYLTLMQRLADQQNNGN